MGGLGTGLVVVRVRRHSRVVRACRLLHSHHTSRPNDSASSARATTRAAWVAVRRQDVGRRDGQHDPLRRRDDLAPEARRQRRAHPRQRPPGGEERVACRADREHPHAPAERATYTLRTRIRNASTSPSKRAPRLAVVRVRRATHPSTASSASATAASDTSSVTGTGSPNESATSAATPTASVARASVTQLAGPSRSAR